LVQPLNKGCIKDLMAVASSNLNVALEDSAIWQMRCARRQGGGQGFFHQGGPGRTRRSHFGIHTMASPAVCTCCLPRKAALRSEAEMASIMTARVFCGRVSQVFLATFEPEIDVLEWPGTNF
jgi:hypothetical protein